MASRWLFKQLVDQPMLWTWRLLAADDCIQQQASDFDNYGAAVNDAIRNGFRPEEDNWIVYAARETTHHEHGRKPLVILKTDPKLLLSLRSGPDKEGFRGKQVANEEGAGSNHANSLKRSN